MARLISQLNAPALAGVVRAETAGEAVAEIRNCLTHGADMIDQLQIFMK